MHSRRPLSQVDTHVDMETNDAGMNECLPQAGGAQQEIRMSSRIISQDLHSTRISDRASRNAAARDVSGTNLTSHNSFALLDDDVIRDRALEMGVNPETFTMEKINYFKDLEQAMHAIAVAQAAQDLDTKSDSDFFCFWALREIKVWRERMILHMWCLQGTGRREEVWENLGKRERHQQNRLFS
jgi:hypothetical protein